MSLVGITPSFIWFYLNRKIGYRVIQKFYSFQREFVVCSSRRYGLEMVELLTVCRLFYFLSFIMLLSSVCEHLNVALHHAHCKCPGAKFSKLS